MRIEWQWTKKSYSVGKPYGGWEIAGPKITFRGRTYQLYIESYWEWDPFSRIGPSIGPFWLDTQAEEDN